MLAVIYSYHKFLLIKTGLKEMIKLERKCTGTLVNNNNDFFTMYDPFYVTFTFIFHFLVTTEKINICMKTHITATYIQRETD